MKPCLWKKHEGLTKISPDWVPANSRASETARAIIELSLLTLWNRTGGSRALESTLAIWWEPLISVSVRASWPPAIDPQLNAILESAMRTCEVPSIVGRSGVCLGNHVCRPVIGLLHVHQFMNLHVLYGWNVSQRAEHPVTVKCRLRLHCTGATHG